MAWKIGGAVLAGVVLIVGIVAYTVFKPPAQASGPVQSVAIERASGTATAPAAAPVFEIEPGESQARFVIDEILRGEPKTVVGVTNQVAGQIAVDPTNPDAARIGEIRINARTLATDSTSRDRMVQNQILATAEHEYIAFRPKELVGLPDRAGIGETMRFSIVGDLSIRGVTREVIFDATVTPESASRLAGNASTTIRYAEWGIAIPRVPSVTGVSDDVQLHVDFVATTG